MVNNFVCPYMKCRKANHMKQTAILTTTSLLSILFMTFHLTDDILFKMAPPGLANLFAVLIFVV